MGDEALTKSLKSCQGSCVCQVLFHYLTGVALGALLFFNCFIESTNGYGNENSEHLQAYSCLEVAYQTLKCRFWLAHLSFLLPEERMSGSLELKSSLYSYL